MRIRRIKAHVTQITICGVLVYAFLSILSSSNTNSESSISRRYKEHQRRVNSERKLPAHQDSNELTLTSIERMNQQIRGPENPHNGDDAGNILESIYSQIPGGKEAVARRDPAALEALKSLLKNRNQDIAAKKQISFDTIKDMASHLLHSNSILNKGSSHANSNDVTVEIMSRLIKDFPNLKNNQAAQEAIMLKLKGANPNILELMKFLKKRQSHNSANVQSMSSRELVDMLDNFYKQNNQKTSSKQKNFPETEGHFEYNGVDASNVLSQNVDEGEKSIDKYSNQGVAPHSPDDNQLQQGDLYEHGELNLHELLKLKFMLNNGVTLEDLKKKYHLNSPQLIGRSLLAGENDEETKTDLNEPVTNDKDEKAPRDGGIEMSKQNQRLKDEAGRPRISDRSVYEDERGRGKNQDNGKDARLNGVQGGGRRGKDAAITREMTVRERTKSEDDFIYMSAQEYDELMKVQKGGVTKRPNLDFKKIRIAVVESDRSGTIDNVTKVLTIQEYKRWKADMFIKKFANPVEKSELKPTLAPYGDFIARPNPRSIIKDLTMRVEYEEIEQVLALDKKRRLALGDDDLLEIPEVKLELSLNPDTITNIIHFIWFSCRKYRVHHFMSMKSALHVHSPRVILLHTDCVPNGTYFEEFLKMAGHQLRIVKRTSPTSVWGNKIEKVEHRSDVARLQVLLEVGGVYMDDDVLILKPLDPLLNNSMVLGEETYDALANSIVLANKDAWFLKRWYQEYKTFNGSKWSHSSCFVPWSLWQIFPDMIHVVKEKLLRPNWEELTYIYHELWDWTDSYSMHLYSRFMGALDGTRERTLQELAILNTTYGEVSRFILWGNSRTRDITNWV